MSRANRLALGLFLLWTTVAPAPKAYWMLVIILPLAFAAMWLISHAIFHADKERRP